MPHRDILRVAGLELYEFLLRLFEPRRIRVALGVDNFVEPLQFCDGVLLQRGAIQNLFPAEQQLPELRPPIANVVVRNDLVTEQSQHTLKRVANARRTDVADVHRLGDVRRTEINDDGARPSRLGKEHMFTARR